MSTRLRLYRNPLHQLVAGSTWRAAWFLLAYLVWGWLLWAAVFAATLTAAVLCITLAGIPLLIAAAGVIRGCANAERWRLRGVLAGPIHGGYRAVRRPGILGQVRTRWSDPATWRDFAYLFALFPLLWALDLAVLVVWLVLLAGITVPAWYWSVPETFNNGQSRVTACSSATSRTARAGPAHGAGSWATLHQALIAAADLPGAVPAVQLRAGGRRPAARPDRQRAAARARRPDGRSEGGARPGRARWARCTLNQNPLNRCIRSQCIRRIDAVPSPMRDQLMGEGLRPTHAPP